MVAGVCDFAVDPRLDASTAELHWLPAVDPRVVRLLADATGSAVVAMPPAATHTERRAEEGHYVLLGTEGNLSAALVHSGTEFGDPLMALVPLDLDTAIRLEAVLRLWRRLTGQSSPTPPDPLSAGRRKRLAMMLRAVDARRAGANRREIAETIFGERAVPEGVAFDDHHLRSRTTRLVRDGLAMIAGGYRKFLKD